MSGMSRGASGRTAISPSDSVGGTIAGIGQVWRSPDRQRLLPACAAMKRPIARGSSGGVAGKRRPIARGSSGGVAGKRRPIARGSSGGVAGKRRPIARAIFWSAAAKLAWAQIGYGAFLAALRRARGDPPVAPAGDAGTPLVSLIVAAYREQDVIASKVADALALDWPRDRLEIVVAVDGGADAGADATAERARAAGADAAARGELLAFSDANASWEPGALRALLAPFADPEVGYVCGQVRFVNDAGTNQEGLYWRYEMWLRANESALASVTAGNGAIYALRREAYMHVDAVMGHDLSFPFNVVKRGRRAVYAPGARVTEKMVPSIEGEGARKRRMMSHAWAILLRGGMLSPRGYPPLYALMIASHRVLRYASPLLHLAAAAATLALMREGRAYRAAALGQAGLLAAGAAGGHIRVRPLLVARYYVATTAALGAGLYDHLRHGTPAVWEAAEGTR